MECIIIKGTFAFTRKASQNSQKCGKSLILRKRVGSAKFTKVRICVRQKTHENLAKKHCFKDLRVNNYWAFCKQTCPNKYIEVIIIFVRSSNINKFTLRLKQLISPHAEKSNGLFFPCLTSHNLYYNNRKKKKEAKVTKGNFNFMIKVSLQYSVRRI